MSIIFHISNHSENITEGRGFMGGGGHPYFAIHFASICQMFDIDINIWKMFEANVCETFWKHLPNIVIKHLANICLFSQVFGKICLV